ncbi:MAG: glycosyltransferase family 2 protein [Gemmatimonadetes bacterium]|nr:glycosyltransferase family 2 protein [Gemmatimonadota bacterium]
MAVNGTAADTTPAAEPGARPDASRPDLSVVIVNRNTRGLLHDCLHSIRRLPDPVRLELILVDNGSTDGSVEMVEEEFPDARLIRNPTNTGYAYPNNQGLSVSHGRYVLLLNSDTVLHPGALGRLVEFMDAHPEAGACGPALQYPDGSLQRSCYSLPSPRTYLSRMLALDELFPRSRVFGNQHLGFDHRHTAPVEALLGAALLCRREVLETVGALDERFRIHYNDFDWCRRILDAGWRIYFVHDASVVHHSAATTRIENDSLRIQGELVRNLFDYYEKHYGRGGVLWVRFWMLVGFGIRFLLFAARDLVRPSRADPVSRRFRLGMVRAALSGDPHQFGYAPAVLAPGGSR